jgi:arsenite/tail-anchored protein-transporting ATPase
MSWNIPSAMGAEPAITVMLIGAPDKEQAWYQKFSVDARFRVVSRASTSKAMLEFLGGEKNEPEVYFVDGRVFAGPAELQEVLSKLSGAVYLLVPDSADDDAISPLKGLPCVKSIYRGDANMQDWLSRAWSDATTKRRMSPPVFSGDEPRPEQGGMPRAAQQVVTGTRVVTVWSRAGGTGRSTVAAGLAMASARKGIKSLLVGLDAPDVIPLHLNGLAPDPNITAYTANPNEVGLRGATQRLGDLDVIPGFPDMLAEGQASGNKDLVQNLVQLAAFKGGYAAIVLDTPANSDTTPGAIAAANTWVMVCRPTLADAWKAVDAVRMVTQKAAGQFRIDAANILVVLNQRTQGQLTAGEWHKAADQAARSAGLSSGFPSIAAVVPFIAELPPAQDAGRPAMDASDEFARQMNRLADTLFGSVVGQGEKAIDNSKVFKIGPIKIRSGG